MRGGCIDAIRRCRRRAPPPPLAFQVRCSPSRTLSSSTRSGSGRLCTPCPALPSTSARAKPSAWSVSRGVESPVPRAHGRVFPGKERTVVFEVLELTLPHRTTRTPVGPATLQVIFQDPISSLTRAGRLGDIVGEPLAIWRHAPSTLPHAYGTCSTCGLAPDMADLRPFQLSGGQCQARQSHGR